MTSPDLPAAARTAADGYPLIAGFFPDPTICRHRGLYVLAHSSFEYAPAIPIWVSKDLTTWTHVTNALTREPQLRLQPMRFWLDGSEMLPGSDGIPVGSANTGTFAPTIRSHGDRLFLAVTNVSDFLDGPLIYTSESPEGPWSDPVQVPGLPGIDPDLYWDESGIAHLTVSSYANGGPHVTSAPVNLETGELLGEPKELWSGTGGQAPESPHLFMHEGWLYLLLAEGGTERGHAVTIARSRGIDGPWEANPDNPILTHRGLDRPVLNTGHADLVQGPDGRFAMVYLGVRARGFSGFHVNGRETFLAEVEWREGWPVVNESGYPLPEREHSFTDTFDGPALHPRWVSPGRLPATFTSISAPGLEVRADGEALAHYFLAMRPQDEYWTVEMDADVLGEAGITLRVDEIHSADVLLDETGAVTTVVRVGDLERRLTHTAENGASLFIRVRPDGRPPLRRGPDVVELGVMDGDNPRVLDTVDGRYLSVEVAGGWTGRVVGPRIVRGSANISAFRYQADPVGDA
ncbi:glycoside hydrolase family 43 protein [Microbacterium enclense]|uniref:Beta-xylosidase n=1 Tax=Microbacterium enclense TaxID=993073 RepID=A0A1G6JFL8_9MICO|nr:glycoside hydrolase family 43 protein [Microbacterium enclense]KSU54833.1 hypothetical protein AS029_07755 [Microbacterium enclense]SDC17509.1 Beta-xylosidase [Microbacterium enclense]